jgi:ketosteroid isomerase-like protein
MSQENVEIVRRFLVVDLDELLAYVDRDIVWNPVEESSAQGPEAVRASTERWKSEWDDYQLIPEEFVDMGDRVVATVRFRARGRGSGIEVDARPLRRLHAPHLCAPDGRRPRRRRVPRTGGHGRRSQWRRRS